MERAFVDHEGPTWVLAVVIYGGWLLLTRHWQAVPLPVLVASGAWLTAWHMSFQHEILHGHPTRSIAVNTALGFPPLSLWLPYCRYRESHLAHHREPILTDPLEDPESHYVTPADWARRGRFGRGLLWVNNTLAGRVLIGPGVGIARFLAAEAGSLAAGSPEARRIWLVHAAGVAAVLAWVVGVCGMPLWVYIACFVHSGFALALVRSFAEHRAAERPEHRTAIVERAPVLGLLFLYNNLHVVHHLWPGLPWYAIPARYRRDRAALIARNGGLVYRGYADIMRRFLLTPHDAPAGGANR